MLFRSAASLHAQLLPKSRHLQGVVVDQSGAPIPNASIDHSDKNLFNPTDERGRFSLDTRAPFVVIRAAGYRSRRLSTSTKFPARITLNNAPAFPRCPTHNFDRIGIEAPSRYSGSSQRLKWRSARRDRTPTTLARSYVLNTSKGEIGRAHV